MAKDSNQGCVSVAKGPVSAGEDDQPEIIKAKESRMSVMVGQTAPDFEASAYFEGGFKNFSLSEFRGKWVFLCFYPGDFTFV